MFSKIWRGAVLLALILFGAQNLAVGLFLASISDHLKPSPQVANWPLMATLLAALGLGAMLLVTFLSRRWNQPFWTRASWVSLICGGIAFCVAIFLYARPATIVKRTVQSKSSGPNVMHYEIKPGWPNLFPSRFEVQQEISQSVDFERLDQVAICEAYQRYVSTDECVSLDCFLGVLMVLLPLYGCELVGFAVQSRRDSPPPL